MTTIPTPSDPESIRRNVRERYAEVAREGSSCCGSACGCGADEELLQGIDMIGDAYDGVDGYVPEADLKLGCGVPVEHAGLAEGLTVLDLGSGAGLDVFVARSIVGDRGRVIGVDFTPEMIERARRNAAMLGYANVEFRLGEIENLPVESGSVDVVISNCVLNLVPDKPRAFAEIHRVLKPGAHFCVSDIVTLGDLPDALRESAAAYAGCVSGAVGESDYREIVAGAGFESVETVARREIHVPESLYERLGDAVRESTPRPALASVTVRARRSPA